MSGTCGTASLIAMSGSALIQKIKMIVIIWRKNIFDFSGKGEEKSLNTGTFEYLLKIKTKIDKWSPCRKLV